LGFTPCRLRLIAELHLGGAQDAVDQFQSDDLIGSQLDRAICKAVGIGSRLARFQRIHFGDDEAR
jgi:hypothetical protein